MDPTVEAALISAAATVIGVGGTVIVAVTAARNARQADRAARDDAREALRASREDAEQARAAASEALNASREDAQRTLDTAREAQYADRYSRAIEQLGSDNLNIRIGGIYALEGIATDSPRYHPTVVEVLTAFIREYSRTPPGGRPERWPLPDIQTAVTVLGRRKTEHDTRRVDLIGVDLTGVDLSYADLSYADLTDTHLTNAYLFGANLSEADLERTNLSLADLSQVDFTRADFNNTNLSRAKLVGARLSEVDLAGADLTGAILTSDAEVPEGWKLNDEGRLRRDPDH